MAWLPLVCLEGLPPSHVGTVRVPSMAGSTVLAAGSTLLAARMPLLPHCLPSTGWGRPGASRAHPRLQRMLLLLVFLLRGLDEQDLGVWAGTQKVDERSPRTGISRSPLCRVCVGDGGGAQLGFHYLQGFTGSPPLPQGPQETPQVSSLCPGSIL